MRLSHHVLLSSQQSITPPGAAGKAVLPCRRQSDLLDWSPRPLSTREGKGVTSRRPRPYRDVGLRWPGYRPVSRA